MRSNGILMSCAPISGVSYDAYSRVAGVDAAYGPTQVLQAVDRGGGGGITALLGANGAGKTTTLRSICNMMVRVSGEISFGGERIDGRATEESCDSESAMCRTVAAPSSVSRSRRICGLGPILAATGARCGL